ncbi:FkbM family methyltransferase [uncultured Methanobrevibacter sp.]|uniref:FkbM family methyltransferase n=1 Tax=uncultured Methanobrevibacter sp. TaxID=253161 RepID=UPI0025F46CE1|nr:FkbM family methyltransferase [uncultured Methanobrevibacter sp.]
MNIIDYQDRYVIDIGGNIGDTALYFVKSGANVISFEPGKHLYELAVENVNLNPTLKDKITFVNKTIGGKKRKTSS